MYERASWESITARADDVLTNYLIRQGLELNLSTFPREFRNRLSKYFKQREKDLLETTYSFVLRDVLKAWPANASGPWKAAASSIITGCLAASTKMASLKKSPNSMGWMVR